MHRTASLKLSQSATELLGAALSADKDNVRSQKDALIDCVCACMIKEPSYTAVPLSASGGSLPDPSGSDSPSVATTSTTDDGARGPADPIAQIVQLVHGISAEDGEFVLKLALYVRQDLGIRGTANFLTALCAYQPKCLPFLSCYMDKIVRLPSDWLQVATLAYGMPQRTSKGLPNALRRALEAVFQQFDEFSLAKYNNESALKAQTRRRESAKNRSDTHPTSDHSQAPVAQLRRATARGAAARAQKRQSIAPYGIPEELVEVLQATGDGSSPQHGNASSQPFTLKQMVRMLHLSKPVYAVMCILGKPYPRTREEFVRLGLGADGGVDCDRHQATSTAPTSESVPDLPPLVLESCEGICSKGEYPTSPRTEAPYTQKQRTFDPALAGKRMRLPIPVTWERELSNRGNTAQVWQDLIHEGKLPYMAMLRNLKNLIVQRIDVQTRDIVLSRLKSEAQVASSRQAPYRFFSAFEAIKVEPAEVLAAMGHRGAPSPTRKRATSQLQKHKSVSRLKAERALRRRWSPSSLPFITITLAAERELYAAALSRAVALAAKLNVVPIRGKSVLILRVTRDLFRPVTAIGSRTATASKRQYIDLAALLTVMFIHACEECSVVLTCGAQHVLYDPDRAGHRESSKGTSVARGGLLEEVERVLQRALKLLPHDALLPRGCSTESKEAAELPEEGAFPFHFVDHLIQQRVPIVSLVVIDSGHHTYSGCNETAPSLGDLRSYLSRLRRTCNEDMLYVAINITGSVGDASKSAMSAFSLMSFSHRNDVLLSGFSDSVLRLVAERSGGGPRRHVEHMDEAFCVRRPVLANPSGKSKKVKELRLVLEDLHRQPGSTTIKSSSISDSVEENGSFCGLTTSGPAGLSSRGTLDREAAASHLGPGSTSFCSRNEDEDEVLGSTSLKQQMANAVGQEANLFTLDGSSTGRAARPKVRFATVENSSQPIGRITLYSAPSSHAKELQVSTHDGLWERRFEDKGGQSRGIVLGTETQSSPLLSHSSLSGDLDAAAEDFVDDTSPEAGREAPYHRPVLSTYHTCRFFISSTFLDMNNERNSLVLDVFPRIRRWVQRRGIKANVIEVDLRWGITEAASADNLSLSVCLNEVSRCTPFFIGIVGSRYGSCPTLPLNIVPDEDVDVGNFSWLWKLPDPEVGLAAPRRCSNAQNSCPSDPQQALKAPKSSSSTVLSSLDVQIAQNENRRRVAEALTARELFQFGFEKRKREEPSQLSRRQQLDGDKAIASTARELPTASGSAVRAMNLPAGVEGRAGCVSVTELEMRHALFNAPRRADGSAQGAVFFLRDQSELIGSLPVDQKAAFSYESPQASDSVNRLAAHIRAQNAPVIPYVARYSKDGDRGLEPRHSGAAVPGWPPVNQLPGLGDLQSRAPTALHITLDMSDFSDKAFEAIKSVVEELCGPGEDLDSSDNTTENSDEATWPESSCQNGASSAAESPYTKEYHSQMNFAAAKMSAYVPPQGLIEDMTLFVLGSTATPSHAPCTASAATAPRSIVQWPDAEVELGSIPAISSDGNALSTLEVHRAPSLASNVLLLIGLEGNGKSSAAAAALYHLQQNHGDIVVVFFSVHASDESKSVCSVAHYIAQTLTLLLQLEELPLTNDETTEALLLMLASVYAEVRRKGVPVVIILDGLEKSTYSEYLLRSMGSLVEPLSGEEGECNIRYIVTSTPSSPIAHALQSRYPPSVNVCIPPLTLGERARLVRYHLASYGKRLQESLGRTNELKPLLRKKDSSQPAYLIQAITYLRLFSTYDSLRADITRIPDTLAQLYTETVYQLEVRFTQPTCRTLFVALLLNGEIEGIMEHTLLRLVPDVAGASRLLALLNGTFVSFYKGKVIISSSPFQSCVLARYLPKSTDVSDAYEQLLVSQFFLRPLSLGTGAQTGNGMPFMLSGMDVVRGGPFIAPVSGMAARHLGPGGLLNVDAHDSPAVANVRVLLKYAVQLLKNASSSARHMRGTASAKWPTPGAGGAAYRATFSNIPAQLAQGSYGSTTHVEGVQMLSAEFDAERYAPHGIIALLYYAVRASQLELFALLACHLPVLESIVETPELMERLILLSSEVCSRGSPHTRKLSPLVQFLQQKAHVLRRRPRLLRQCILNDAEMLKFFGGESEVRQPKDWIQWINAAQLSGRLCYSTSTPSAEPLLSLAYSQAGNMIAAGGVDQRVHTLYSNAAGTVLATLKHPDVVTAVLFLPSKVEKVVTGCADGMLRVWSLNDNSLLQEGRFHTRGVTCLSRHPSNDLLCSAGMDGNCAVWTFLPPGGLEAAAAPSTHNGATKPLPLQQSGKRDMGQPAGRHALGPLATLRHHLAPVSSTSFHASGTVLATGSWDGTVHFLNVSSLRAEQSLATKRGAGGASAKEAPRDHRTEKRLVFVAGCTVRALSFVPSLVITCAIALYDGSVCIYDHAAAACSSRLRLHPGIPITALTFSPDAKLMLTADELGTLRLTYAGVQGTPVGSLSGHSQAVTAVAFHPDNSQLATSASRDSTICHWHLKQESAEAGEEPTVFSSHSMAVTVCGVAKDGSFFVTASADGEALFFSTDGKNERADVAVASCYALSTTATSAKPVFSIVEAGDSASTVLTCAEASVMVEELVQQVLRAQPQPHTSTVFTALFSMPHDGQRITCIRIPDDNSKVVCGTAFGWLFVWATTPGIDPKRGRLLRKLCLTENLPYPVVHIHLPLLVVDEIDRRAHFVGNACTPNERETASTPPGEVWAMCSSGLFGTWGSESELLRSVPKTGAVAWNMRLPLGSNEPGEKRTGLWRQKMTALLGEEIIGCIPLTSLQVGNRKQGATNDSTAPAPGTSHVAPTTFETAGCFDDNSGLGGTDVWSAEACDDTGQGNVEKTEACDAKLVLLVGVHRCLVASMRHGVVFAAASEAPQVHMPHETHGRAGPTVEVPPQSATARNVEMSATRPVASVNLGAHEYFSAFSPAAVVLPEGPPSPVVRGVHSSCTRKPQDGAKVPRAPWIPAESGQQLQQSWNTSKISHASPLVSAITDPPRMEWGQRPKRDERSRGAAARSPITAFSFCPAAAKRTLSDSVPVPSSETELSSDVASRPKSRKACLIALGTNEGNVFLFEVSLSAPMPANDAPLPQCKDSTVAATDTAMESLLARVHFQLVQRVRLGEPSSTSTSSHAVLSLAMSTVRPPPPVPSLMVGPTRTAACTGRLPSQALWESSKTGSGSQPRPQRSSSNGICESEPPQQGISVELSGHAPNVLLLAGCRDNSVRVFTLQPLVGAARVGSASSVAPHTFTQRNPTGDLPPLHTGHDTTTTTGLVNPVQRHHYSLQEAGIFFTSSPVTAISVVGSPLYCFGHRSKWEMGAPNRSCSAATTEVAIGERAPGYAQSSQPPRGSFVGNLVRVLRAMCVVGDSMGNVYQLRLHRASPVPVVLRSPVR